MRFLTQGGAAVELRMAFDEHGLDGRQWYCLGCDTVGGRGPDHLPYHYFQADRARKEANDHAIECRSMPKNGGSPAPSRL